MVYTNCLKTTKFSNPGDDNKKCTIFPATSSSTAQKNLCFVYYYEGNLSKNFFSLLEMSFRRLSDVAINITTRSNLGKRVIPKPLQVREAVHRAQKILFHQRSF